MTVVESKLKKGKLTLDGKSFACQATNVTIASNYTGDTAGEALETLCGDQLSGGEAGTTVTRNLNITAIQDFDNPDGLMRFLRDNELSDVDFMWQANSKAEIAEGQLECRVGDWGGDVAKRLTSSLSLPISTLDWKEPPQPATDVSEGKPGKFLPDGSRPPANKSELDKITPSNKTAWTGGNYVDVNASKYHWNGTRWVAGVAP